MTQRNKINYLLQQILPHQVITQQWLNQQGYSHALVQRYLDSNWLIRIGHGAFVRSGDQPTWEGAIYTLQTQLQLPVHIGAKSALQLSGKSHYISLALEQQFTELYFHQSVKNARLPKWFKDYPWKKPVRLHTENLFSETDIGLTKLKTEHFFELVIASPERAMIEMLAGIPQYYSLSEAYHIMQGLVSLRPEMVQSLLESCLSHKAKRLFLLLADLTQLGWFKRLNLKHVDLGKGKRSIAGGGKYYSNYLLSIPPLQADLNEEDIP